MQNTVKLTLENGEVIEVKTTLSKSEKKTLINAIVCDTFADDFVNPNYTDFDYSLISRFTQAVCVDAGLPEGEEEIYEWVWECGFIDQYATVNNDLFEYIRDCSRIQVEHRIRKNLAMNAQDNTANDTLVAVAGVAYKAIELLDLAKTKIDVFSDGFGKEEFQELVKNIVTGSINTSDNSEVLDSDDDVKIIEYN